MSTSRRLGVLVMVAVVGMAVGAKIASVAQESPDRHTSVASDGSAPPALGTALAGYPSTPGSAPAPNAPGRSSTPERRAVDTPKQPARFQPFGVVGQDDDRVPVTLPHPHPERAIVHIKTDAASTLCTGWLVGEDTVVTAGHCVHTGGNVGKPRWAPLNSIVVRSNVDGQNGITTTPYPICGARRLYSTTAWIREGGNGPEEYDYGAIKLNCPLGKIVGTLGLAIAPSPWPQPGSLQVIGYDNNTSAAECKIPSTWVRLCRGPGKVALVSGGLLFYDADTELSESGSPVILPGKCNGCVVGIHTSSYHADELEIHRKLNHGTLITERVFNNLQAWRNARID